MYADDCLVDMSGERYDCRIDRHRPHMTTCTCRLGSNWQDGLSSSRAMNYVFLRSYDHTNQCDPNDGWTALGRFEKTCYHHCGGNQNLHVDCMVYWDNMTTTVCSCVNHKVTVFALVKPSNQIWKLHNPHNSGRFFENHHHRESPCQPFDGHDPNFPSWQDPHQPPRGGYDDRFPLGGGGGTQLPGVVYGEIFPGGRGHDGTFHPGGDGHLQVDVDYSARRISKRHLIEEMQSTNIADSQSPFSDSQSATSPDSMPLSLAVLRQGNPEDDGYNFGSDEFYSTVAPRMELSNRTNVFPTSMSMIMSASSYNSSGMPGDASASQTTGRDQNFNQVSSATPQTMKKKYGQAVTSPSPTKVNVDGITGKGVGDFFNVGKPLTPDSVVLVDRFSEKTQTEVVFESDAKTPETFNGDGSISQTSLPPHIKPEQVENDWSVDTKTDEPSEYNSTNIVSIAMYCGVSLFAFALIFLMIFFWRKYIHKKELKLKQNQQHDYLPN